MPPPQPESDNPIRRYLIHYLLERPFIPLLIRLEGGYELRVASHGFASFDPGVLVMTVFHPDGASEVFSTDRIVSLKLLETAT